MHNATAVPRRKAMPATFGRMWQAGASVFVSLRKRFESYVGAKGDDVLASDGLKRRAPKLAHSGAPDARGGDFLGETQKRGVPKLAGFGRGHARD